MSLKPLPFIIVQSVTHYAMPENEVLGTVARHTICGISTLIPGRRVPLKNNTLECKSCQAIVKHIHMHQRKRYVKRRSS